MCRGALNASRLVDNPFEHPNDRITLERTPRVLAVRAHVVEYLRLAIGLVHLEAERLLQLAYLERAVGALAEQLDQPFIELIDPLPEFVDCHQSPRNRHSLASERTILPSPS